MDEYIVVPNHRIPYISNDYLKSAINRQKKLAGNDVKTTKYSIYNFVPKNIFEQFHRFANVYFVAICILNFVPQVEAINPLMALGPVLFIFSVTAIKDGVENYKRYVSDKEINSKASNILINNSFIPKRWEDIKVGDLIRVYLNEVIPADVLLLESADENDVCFIETANLDGETNLKQKRTIDVDFEHYEDFNYYISTQQPNSDLTKFHGYIGAFNQETNCNKKALRPDNVIYRGCVLRNTDNIVGLVIYTGKKTKAMLSNRGMHHKMSYLERLMNGDIILFAALLLVLCIICAVVSIQIQIQDGVTLWYIPYISDELSNAVSGLFIFLTMIILLQILIPISLYVSLELVKLLQVGFIAWDDKMFNKEYQAGVSCRSLNITEDLGCIEHIFCDKTGTLTENSMVFRAFSINGTNYHHDAQSEMIQSAKSSEPSVSGASKNAPEGEASSNVRIHHRRVISDLTELKKEIKLENSNALETTVKPDLAAEELISNFADFANVANQFMMCLACCNTVIISVEQRSKYIKNPPPATPGGIKTPMDLIKGGILTVLKPLRGKKHKRRKKSTISIEGENNGGFNYSPPTMPSNGLSANRLRPKTLILGNDELNLKNVSFNFAEEPTNYLDPDEVIYEAESPDEAALVYAAKGYGVSLMRRLHSAVLLKWPGQEELVKVKYLAIFPFDSTRKMMSVLIQTPQGALLLTKGADSSIFSRLSDDHDPETIENTKNHVHAYSMRGLRTLCIAKRDLTHDETDEILRKINKAETLLVGREHELDEIYGEYESRLTILGATAIEDRLQDGVPDAIDNLRQAGIAIWILTGDKMETAVEISRLCGLLKSDDQLIQISNTSSALTLDQLDELYLAEPNLSEFRNNDIFTDLCKKQTKKLLRTSKKVLCINGPDLRFLIDKHSVKFITYAASCRAVICCRTTPKSKGVVVSLCKRILNVRALAIGDGANDVAMIRSANVGVGISGQEGRQAVMASDFAMPRFYQLTRLLLVHGHLSYARMARMIEYFYYKNTVFILLIFWFQFFNKFSGSAMIPSMYLILFMLLFNSVPGMVNGSFDKLLSLQTLASNPPIFQNCSQNKMFGRRVFWITLLDCFWQSLVQFFVPYFVFMQSGETYNGRHLETGSSISFYVFGTIVANASLFSQFLHLAIETFTWTYIHFAFIILSYVLFYLAGIISGVMESTGQGEYYGMIYILAQPISYLTVTIAGVLSVLPRFTIILLLNTIKPSEWFVLRKNE